MTLDKAIEILEHEVTCRDCFDNTDRYHALKLGIEALKCITEMRTDHYILPYPLLPGETHD